VAFQLASSRRRSAVGESGSAVYATRSWPAVARRCEGLVTELEGAHHRVLEKLGAVGLLLDLLSGPQPPEVRVLHGELVDQLGQPRVLGMAAGVEAEIRDGLGGDGLPVGVEGTGARVEERVPGGVALPDSHGAETAEPVGQGVPGDDVHAPAEHERGHGLHQVEQPL